MAYNATIDAFPEPYKEIRALYPFSHSNTWPIVREDSGIDSIVDLDDKPFNPGMAGSGTALAFTTMFDALGIEPDYRYMSLSDAVDAVKDRRIVGYCKGAGYGSLDATTIDLKAFTDIKMLGFTQEQAVEVKEKAPWFFLEYIPKGLYDGLPEAGDFYLRWYSLLAHTTSTLPEEAGYWITKIHCENQDELAKAYSGAGLFPTLENIEDYLEAKAGEDFPPLHAGAVRYFREMGKEIPDAAVPPEFLP
jgi:TRAP transporter TAXI family solute receptor